MSPVRAELEAALERSHPGSRLVTLPGDASTRRFHRLFLASGGTLIVMDYERPFEGETDDVRLARIFLRASLPVAAVVEVLPAAGCLLLEDFGYQTLESALATAAGEPEREALRYAAVELAAEIASRGTEALGSSDRAEGPALDRERFLFEMRFFVENYVGRLLGRPSPPPALVNALERLAEECATHPRVLCHRDYHSRNLMVRRDGTLAMVDIQDARWGPDTYDIASLLRDAYVDIEEREVGDLFEGYRRLGWEPPDQQSFEQRFRLVSGQRMIKALGTFGYQIAVLGRERYRSAIPRTVARIRELLPQSSRTSELGARLEEAKAL